MRADDLVQIADARDAVGDPTFAEHSPLEVHHAHIVMVLCPVHTNEDHRSLLFDCDFTSQRRSAAT
jgi:hypothetical protein